MGLFGAGHGWVELAKTPAPLPKICYSYSTIMKLGTAIKETQLLAPYLKKIQELYKPRDIFFTKNKSFLLYWKPQIEIPFQ